MHPRAFSEKSFICEYQEQVDRLDLRSVIAKLETCPPPPPITPLWGGDTPPILVPPRVDNFEEKIILFLFHAGDVSFSPEYGYDPSPKYGSSCTEYNGIVNHAVK